MTKTKRNKISKRIKKINQPYFDNGEKGLDKIIVTSVVPLSKEQLLVIGKVLPEFVDKKAPIINVIDKKILAGFTISVRDWFLDASLIYEIKDFKQRLLS